MSNPLEPSDVGPAAGGDLVATDLDRDHVVSLLTAAQAEGRLTPAERDQRIAELQAELDAVRSQREARDDEMRDDEEIRDESAAQ